MKVLHISRTMGQGGAEKIVYQLCRDNSAQEQIVVSCGGVYADKLEQDGIKQYKIPDLDNKNPFVMLKCLALIFTIVRREKIDVIHSHHRMAAFYARIVAMFLGTEQVYTAHNVFFNKIRLLQFALKGSSIVAVGDGVKRNLIDTYAIDPEQIRTIKNTIRNTRSKQYNPLLTQLREQGKILIGSIGRLSRQKGMDVFVKAFGMLRQQHPEKDLVAVIVGEGEDHAELESLTKVLGLENSVLFLGFQENVLDIITQLDLVVSASRWDGLPLTPIEVFSQKRTMVGTDISGNNEIVKDGVNGILVPVDAPESLSEGMFKIIENPTLKQTLENNAYKTFSSEYNYDDFISSYNEVYELCK